MMSLAFSFQKASFAFVSVNANVSPPCSLPIDRFPEQSPVESVSMLDYKEVHQKWIKNINLKDFVPIKNSTVDFGNFWLATHS